MRIKEIILVSDVDGTILPASGIISQKNINAINKFRESGGTFAIATGRSPLHAKEICKTLSVESMIICNNGACIYDIAGNKNMWTQNLDSSFVDVISFVMNKYPFIGIQAISDDNDYFTVNMSDFLRSEIIGLTEVNLDCPNPYDLPKNICKVLFMIHDPYFNEVSMDILLQGFDKFEFVKSGGACFEMMHCGITKGFPLQKLAELYGKTIKNVVAIGDYYNDVDMLKLAHFSAAVENAPADIKAEADVVVKSCEDDGLADFIDLLFEKYEK